MLVRSSHTCLAPLTSLQRQLLPTAALSLNNTIAATRCLSTATFTAAPAADAGASATPSAVSSSPSSSDSSLPPVSTRVFTSATLRRQALALSSPWYMPTDEFRKLRRGGFGQRVNTRLPFELREHSAEYQIRQLREEERARLAADKERVIADFRSGDRIVVTKYLTLNDRTKIERIAGVVLAREGGTRLNASFLMRAHRIGEDFEIRFPLWSPFIARIDIVEKSQRHPRSKMYYIRKLERSDWDTKVPKEITQLKTQVVPMTIDRRAKEQPKKIQVLNYLPMKKKVAEKKAGGIGAELAAAGAGGGKDAKAAPKKK